MTTYDFMLIVRSDIALDTKQKQEDIIRKLVGDTMQIAEISFLGKKTLAYPIKKQIDGTYLLAKLTGGTLIVGDIEKRVKLDESILRYLLTAKE